jgi:hypothetical protein
VYNKISAVFASEAKQSRLSKKQYVIAATQKRSSQSRALASPGFGRGWKALTRDQYKERRE